MKERTIDWMELAAEACAHAGIAYKSMETVTTWQQKFVDSEHYRNNAVFRLDEGRYLKLFGPTTMRQFAVERAVLETMGRQEAVPAPRLLAAAERPERPPYLFMTAVGGAPAEMCWDDLTRSEQLAVAGEIGSLTAAIHRLPQEGLAAAEREKGGREAYIQEMEAERMAEIEAAETLTRRQRDEMLDYVLGEARELMEGAPCFTHSDFSHAHVFLGRNRGRAVVTGFIDWGEAMLGPPEWDTTFHWFWTFSRDREAMRACLAGYYEDGRRPAHFARLCMARHLYSFSMGELWPPFVEELDAGEAIVPAMRAALFPEDVFGRG